MECIYSVIALGEKLNSSEASASQCKQEPDRKGKGEICVEKITNKQCLVLNFQEMKNMDLWIRLGRIPTGRTDVAINIMKITSASI